MASQASELVLALEAVAELVTLEAGVVVKVVFGRACCACSRARAGCAIRGAGFTCNGCVHGFQVGAVNAAGAIR